MNIDLKDTTCRALVMYKTESRRTKQHNYKTRVFRTELQQLRVEKFEHQYGRKLKEQVNKQSKNIYNMYNILLFLLCLARSLFEINFKMYLPSNLRVL